MIAGGRTAQVRVFDGEPSERDSADQVAEEVPVALVYNGISHAVMMATPADLKDFALGFSITEGILMGRAELYDIEVRESDAGRGIVVDMQIASRRLIETKARRRFLAGRTGCGLCGVESLTQAVREVTPVAAPIVSDVAVERALTRLREHQPLMAATGATHAAAWCDLQGAIRIVREDVGRHNALDKLIGAVLWRGIDTRDGFALVTSRASYEMVQKCCTAKIGALIAVSAATSLAIEHAQNAGLLLIGFARQGRHLRYIAPGASDLDVPENSCYEDSARGAASA